ncbi:MAG: hypothetical protein KDC04_08515 [Saprospiraceae bacterium]|nr:hypothetical protein [Saprospiraceae bacterium]MCB9309448.1 hypothetical protein [Lewinellaceae bacterium]
MTTNRLEAIGKSAFSFTIPLDPNQTIFVHASATPGCFAGSIQMTTFEFDPDIDACDFGDKDTGWLWAQDNGSQAMAYRTSCSKNFWSSYEQAEMYSKWWDGTKWKKGDASLRVEIDAHRKNDVCFEFDHENEVKTCFCSHKAASVNSGIFGAKNFAHHCDGDVTGTFKKTMNWQGQVWSIDRVAEVDFECCE